MTAEQFITDAYLVVAIESLLVQLWHLHRARARQPRLPGLLRTAACRVGCAVLYVVVGTNAYINGGSAALALSFGVYLFINLLWQFNSWLDRRIGRPKKPRKSRRPRLIRVTVTVVRAPAQETTTSEAS